MRRNEVHQSIDKCLEGVRDVLAKVSEAKLVGLAVVVARVFKW